MSFSNIFGRLSVSLPVFQVPTLVELSAVYDIEVTILGNSQLTLIDSNMFAWVECVGGV